MKKYGVILTDRTLGKRIASQILEQESFPVFLNFQGVLSLGSSFGDEIIGVIQKKQSIIPIKNANEAIKDCLEKIATDCEIELTFESRTSHKK